MSRRATALSARAAADALDVSRETLARLETYLTLLERWQRAVNLVGRGSLADPWRRHILDSAQLRDHLPAASRSIVDLGSGAGFPGLVLAILGRPGVHLIESDQRKVAFLREAARITETAVTVHAARIEALPGWVADVVTARGLAPLPRLLDLAERFIGPRTVCLLLKGREVESELTVTARSWHMSVQRCTSRSDPSGVVLKLEELARASGRQP